MRAVAVIATTLLLAACSDPDATDGTVDLSPTPADITYADEAVPSDTRMAGIYDRSCRSCHSVEGMEAPLTGHRPAWAARMDEKGLEGLLASTKNGYKGMPAMGLCNDCSDEDLEALIVFMSKGNRS